jgi:hypothetical protein
MVVKGKINPNQKTTLIDEMLANDLKTFLSCQCEITDTGIHMCKVEALRHVILGEWRRGMELTRARLEDVGGHLN